ncbi:MAG: nucleotide exchange factor GrpE [Chitinophagaceae bacterium]
MEEQINDTLNNVDINEAVTTDENAAAETTTIETETSPEAAETATKKLEAELAEQKDKFLRMMAEFENYKRRTAKERLEVIQTAGKDIIVSLLDVLDDIDRAEKQLETTTDFSTQKEGIQLIFNKVRTSLQNKGLKAMDSVQAEFDVEKHEAITEIPAPSEELVGKVIDEVQKGYLLNDKIVRFAKVVVGK